MNFISNETRIYENCTQKEDYLSLFDFILILIHVSCLQFSLMVLLSNILVTVQFQQILWYNSVSRVTLPNITWWKGRGHLLKITIAAWNCKKNPVLHWNLPTKINVYDSMNCKKGQNINLIAVQLKWNETIKSI